MILFFNSVTSFAEIISQGYCSVVQCLLPWLVRILFLNLHCNIQFFVFNKLVWDFYKDIKKVFMI